MKLGEHTDFGSLSLLFNRLGGLQVLPPGQEEWHYVRPLKGHAIVNLGDAMVKFTNGLLRSNIHRVVSPPGPQASMPRVSIVYFMRPEDSAILKRLDGSKLIPALAEGQVEETICAKDWLHRRVVMRMKGFFSPEKWDQTLGTEVRVS
jgi:isopenicillin N synthase-like dioxygenase